MDSLLTFLLLFTLILSTSTANAQSREADLSIAINQMQKAKYFTFVLLLKMMEDQVPQNITFLMPNDRNLSSISLSTNDIPDFISRHSIPSPLLYDYLRHFPTGSTIPTRKAEYTLRISNGGRKRFYLNNVRLTTPNICSGGSSIKCHGVDAVLEAQPCNQGDHGCNDPSPPMAPPSPASPSPSLPNHTHPVTPPPISNVPNQNSSGCSELVHGRLLVVYALIVTSFLAGIVN